jgi:hypothetical protein
MKSKFLLLFVMALSLGTNAQISINGADLTVKVGDTLKYFKAQPAGLASLPAYKTGGNQTWDFSKLTFENGYYYDRVLSPATAAYPTATFGMPSSASLGAIVIPTTRQFEKTNAVYKDLGFTNVSLKQSLLNVTGGAKDTLYLPSVDIKYSDTYYTFPATFGATKVDTWVQNRPYALTVAAFGLNKTPGNIKNRITATKSIPAWGKVTLPDAKNKGKAIVYNTIVLLYQTSSIDSVFLGGAPAPAALLQAFGLVQGAKSGYAYVECLVPGFKTFALQSEIDANFKPLSVYISSESGFVAGGVAGLKGAAAQIESNVFPNPSQNGQFTLSFDKPSAKDWTVKIYDIAGRQITQNSIFGEGKITQNLSINDGAGTYFYALFNENQEFVTNGVLVVGE